MSIKESLNKLKEIYMGANKKNILIIIVLLLLVLGLIIGGYYAYQNYQYSKSMISDGNIEEPHQESVMYRNSNKATSKKPSEYKIGIPYEKAVKEDKPVIVLFFADWCGYCMRFMPTYESLSKIYKDEYNFSKVNVEESKYEKTVEDYGITAFPTVYIIDPKYDSRILLPNTILSDLKKIRVEVERYSRIRKLLDSK